MKFFPEKYEKENNVFEAFVIQSFLMGWKNNGCEKIKNYSFYSIQKNHITIEFILRGSHLLIRWGKYLERNSKYITTNNPQEYIQKIHEAIVWL